MNIINYLATSRLHGVYELLPQSIKNIYRFLITFRSSLEWKISGVGKKRTKKLLPAWKNKYKGETVIIIGNGPSVKNTNWNLVKNHYTIGLNRINLLFDEMSFVPDFYVCVKDLVVEQFSNELEKIDSKLKIFDFSSGSKYINKYGEETIFIRLLPYHKFCDNIEDGWYSGFTVTFSAMQLAYYLGFTKVILIGVDHNFKVNGPSRREEVKNDDDENHFSKDYFGPGVKWALPDLEGSEHAYQLAKDFFEKNNREIVDASVNGKCTVFRKSTLESEI